MQEGWHGSIARSSSDGAGKCIPQTKKRFENMKNELPKGPKHTPFVWLATVSLLPLALDA